jgi:long-subunit fatty acid transport protein
MKVKFCSLLIFGLLLFLPAVTQAQDGQLIAEMVAGNNFGLGTRAMGMGGAHIASVLDGTALIYNPAALARIRRIELLAGISHQNLDNNVDVNMLGSAIPGFNERGQNKTRLNALNLSIPYPTYRGSLVFAVGLNRIKSFDKTFQVGYSFLDGDIRRDVIGTEAESGSLYALSGGGGIDISPNLSLGLSLNYYFGTDNYSWRLVEGDYPDNLSPLFIDNIEDDYSAVSAKAGILFAASEYISLGATIETPIQYEIEESFVQRTFSDGGEDITAGKTIYDLWTPFSFGAGIGFNINYLHLAADIIYTDWTQMEYKDNPALETDNLFIQQFYRDVLGFSVGGEFLIPRVGLKVRAGFKYDPLPYSDEDLGPGPLFYPGIKVLDDREFFTFGLGYLIDRIMTLDVAVVLGGYRIQDNETSIIEDYDLSRIFITTGFRL